MNLIKKVLLKVLKLQELKILREYRVKSLLNWIRQLCNLVNLKDQRFRLLIIHFLWPSIRKHKVLVHLSQLNMLWINREILLVIIKCLKFFHRTKTTNLLKKAYLHILVNYHKLIDHRPGNSLPLNKLPSYITDQKKFSNKLRISLTSNKLNMMILVET